MEHKSVPSLILQFGGMDKKPEEDESMHEKALQIAAKKVREAFKGSDDKALANALARFHLLCSDIAKEEESEGSDGGYTSSEKE